MDHVLLLLLWTSELVGGFRFNDSRCAGRLEMEHEGEWRPVYGYRWMLKEAAVVCRELDCGSAVSIGQREESSARPVWDISSGCLKSRSVVRWCVKSAKTHLTLIFVCSDSVRLLNGTKLCSGRLEVRSNQSNQGWSSVCEADFDQQDAEVVCRELGCGAPSAHQGALYGEVEAPLWSRDFQCGGNESALLDCRSSDSARTTCSPGKAVGLTCSEFHGFRMVGGDGCCAGRLQLKHGGDGRPVVGYGWTLKDAAVVCRKLDCGSAVSILPKKESSYRSTWWITSNCVQSGSAMRDCVAVFYSSSCLNLTCSDSVRLMNGTGLCSGRLEVRSNQYKQGWSSVCEADFDQQDAEVVCRELGCGAPSALQGALYGEVEAPLWSKEFQCGGNESALLDCRSSDSARTTCSPGKAVGLTCSESEGFRLVGGDTHCAGRLELKHEGDCRSMDGSYWTLKIAAVVCTELDCGSAISTVQREESSERLTWGINSNCVHSGSAVRDCVSPSYSSFYLDLTCSDSFRLLNGTGLCSGRLEVRSNQSNQRWFSVCEADFDQQDAEVVCRELGCGAPTALQGALYGEVEAPVWSRDFQCGGNESALLDCRSSDSARTTCSPGKAVGLTCSEPVRLVGGDSRCAGKLELKHEGEWRPVGGFRWTLKEAAVICRELDCGSAVSIQECEESSERLVWGIDSDCLLSGFGLRECVTFHELYTFIQNLTCSDSVRLLNGTKLCSGRLEDAEVVCRELGCGAPSALQGALYGEVEAPLWSKEFQCGGNESALLDCRSSGSARTTCSPGKAVGLTCSEPIRLVGGDTRCAGRLELKHEGEWRPVDEFDWTLKDAAVVCRELDCGSAVSILQTQESSEIPVFWINSQCLQSGFALRECVMSSTNDYEIFSGILNIICTDLLLQPVISVDGVSHVGQQGSQVVKGFSFTISCSIHPQYPGGFFQLIFTSSFSNAEHNYTQPAVNHSARFLFHAAEPTHQGNYTCVYQVYVFSLNFSSESQRLSVSVSDPTVFFLKVVALPLTLLLLSAALYMYYKATRGQMFNRQEDTELVNYPLGVGAAEEEGDVLGVHLTSGEI
ncbi:scavenger receptor cysteine-rich type 1 protein M130-like isoform X3 [Betta splendens]|uniref:Scavenger receptor cysteine-rich type 1 protein M130-like isoform X3 n=1 Tax=Betta splendens TaxID=158456 RepID=A0A9W2XKU7_BETSP|nr:scavenger receptor cysteine-rich type 1 protein M130-like isoform X3 [Betta splendens]